MAKSIDDLVEQFRQTCDELGESEKRLLTRVALKLHRRRSANREFEDTLTTGQKIADSIAAFVGSWPFILIFLFLLFGWIAVNSFLIARGGKTFDPYPYILLNLMLSMVAALQAPLIMMSQNRQAAKDRLEAEHDYEVNLKAELEILALHQKIDTLRESQWADLVAMQQEQIHLLTKLQQKEQTP